jgi:hypothetical protein
MLNELRPHKISYPQARPRLLGVVFGLHLYSQDAFQLDIRQLADAICP